MAGTLDDPSFVKPAINVFSEFELRFTIGPMSSDAHNVPRLKSIGTAWER